MIKQFFAGISILALAVSVEAKAPTTETSQVPDSLIYTVKSSDKNNYTVLGGSVIPWKMVNLSAQLPGAVEYIAGQEGDEFTSGTALVSLNTASLRAKRKQAVAQYNSAQAGLSNAYVQYKREQLSPNSQANSMLAGAPSLLTAFTDPMRSMSGQSDPDYERHSSMYGQGVQIETAQNQVKQAEAAIQELDENLKNAISRAPFDGKIVKKMIEVGDIIQPGMPLVVFADTNKMKIQVEVPTKLISSIKEGETIPVKLGKNQPLVNATIARIFPMANMGGHTTTMKVNLPENAKTQAGMYAEVMIKNNSDMNKSYPMIPNSAISWRGSLPAVFLISADKTHLKMRNLRIGKSDGKTTTVVSGIKVGDNILLSPQITTRSGSYSK